MDVLLVMIPILSFVLGYFLPQSEIREFEKQIALIVGVSSALSLLNLMPSSLIIDSETMSTFLKNSVGIIIDTTLETVMIAIISSVLGIVGVVIGKNTEIGCV